jgi:hypothetical protein
MTVVEPGEHDVGEGVGVVLTCVESTESNVERLTRDMRSLLQLSSTQIGISDRCGTAVRPNCAAAERYVVFCGYAE